MEQLVGDVIWAIGVIAIGIICWRTHVILKRCEAARRDYRD